MNMDPYTKLTEHHTRIRFIDSPLFHEFVPKQRLTRGKWFGYLGVIVKVSWGDAPREYFKGMLWEIHFERGGALRGGNEGVLSKKKVTVNT